jgi:hypothetical protein
MSPRLWPAGPKTGGRRGRPAAAPSGNSPSAPVPGGPFTLVHLVANSLMNVTTPDDQLAVFANAAAHLAPRQVGGLATVAGYLRQPQPGRGVRAGRPSRHVIVG